MLHPGGEDEATAVEEEEEEGDCVSDGAGTRKRRRHSARMVKELSPEQKALVKMNVSREATEGTVKCCYCDKEISSRNVDRWASHLRGCVRTPEEVKMQIQPYTRTITGSSAASASTPASAPTCSAPHAPLSVPPTASTVSTTAATLNANASAHLGALGSSLSSNYSDTFKVHVSKDYMKFNAAHFIAYKGFREKLHGHNYRVAVTITGVVGPDGYVVDFGEIKKISRVICKDLDESFLVPMNSDALKITFDGTNVHLVTEDMAKFSFPKSDCSLLPIMHSSAEELAVYFSNQLIDAFTLVALLERGVRKIEVSISEANKQFASYERALFPAP